MKAINKFCNKVTRKTLAIKVNMSTAQKLNSSLGTQSPLIQKYAASIAKGKYENGLSSLDVGSKSDLSVTLSCSPVEIFVMFPLNVESLVAIFPGFLSKMYLY